MTTLEAIAEIVGSNYGESQCHRETMELAAVALTEQSERSKGCEVCNGSLPCDNGCDGFCDICDVPEVWKTIHKTGQYNYCPMCGRKLKEAQK